MDNARGVPGVYPAAITLQGVRPRLYWPIALAAAALVALLTYGVAAQGPDTSIDQKLQEGKRVDGLDPATHAVRSASIVLPEGANFHEAARDALRVQAGVEHTSI